MPIPDILQLVDFSIIKPLWVGLLRPILRRFGISDEPRLVVEGTFDRADQDHLRWLHVRVTAQPQKWPAHLVKSIPKCRIGLVFTSPEGDQIAVRGMWAKDEPGEMSLERDLSCGDQPALFSIAVRSTQEHQVRVQPQARLSPNVTYISGAAFLAHGYTNFQLAPGEYEVAIGLQSGGRDWSRTLWRLQNPQIGIADFTMARRESGS